MCRTRSLREYLDFIKLLLKLVWICYLSEIFFWRNKLYLWPESCCFFFLKKQTCPLQLIPLFLFIGGGTVMSLTYLARLALKNPDVWWGCRSRFILKALQSSLSLFKNVFICLKYKVFVTSFFLMTSSRFFVQLGSQEQPRALEQVGPDWSVQGLPVTFFFF